MRACRQGRPRTPPQEHGGFRRRPRFPPQRNRGFRRGPRCGRRQNPKATLGSGGYCRHVVHEPEPCRPRGWSAKTSWTRTTRWFSRPTSPDGWLVPTVPPRSQGEDRLEGSDAGRRAAAEVHRGYRDPGPVARQRRRLRGQPRATGDTRSGTAAVRGHAELDLRVRRRGGSVGGQRTGSRLARASSGPTGHIRRRFARGQASNWPGRAQHGSSKSPARPRTDRGLSFPVRIRDRQGARPEHRGSVVPARGGRRL